MKIIINYLLLTIFITLLSLYLYDSKPKIIIKYPNNNSNKSTICNYKCVID
jgi:hypothetical protein